ncbi:hypothetical protein [Tissierella sp.]|uniref:hypothetical protein n=1 Tax=Tissierella sp. TaxID=41274 RepID=UPI0030289D5B
MKNKEEKGLLIGVNFNKDNLIQINPFEYYKNTNYNVCELGKAGKGMAFHIKNKIVDAEIVNKERDLEGQQFETLVKEFATRGYYLQDLGEQNYTNRYRFTNISIEDNDIEITQNHINTFGVLDNILKFLKTRRTGEYEVEFIKLILDKAPDKEYSYLMAEMESRFNIPLLNDLEWNEKNKDVINLYRAIANQRNLVEENEEDWELEP